MKRIAAWAAFTALILVFGLPLVDADDTSIQLQSSPSGSSNETVAADSDNLTRQAASTVLNVSADARGTASGGENGTDDPQPASPDRVNAAQMRSVPDLFAEDEEKSAAILVAGTGTLLGAGLLWYYWGSIAGILAPLFSRIDKDEILENEVRSRIFDAVEHNPGITIKEVTDVCDVGWGTAVYHLNRLEDEKLLVSQRHRQYRRYFKNGGSIVNGEKKAYSELKHETSQSLAKAVIESPGRMQKELCEEVGISAPVAHKYLDRLASAELVRKEKEWRTVRYFPTEKLGEMMQTPMALTVPA